ncbi:putative deoxyribonuclease YabD [Chlamydiales bacterium STE3]|nr:putative deoxyribonuclease YabD [Chlamydiales bacterium STE3]
MPLQMSLHYIDSHAHVTSDATFLVAEELLKRAKDVGLSAIINICTDLETLERGLQLSKGYPWLYHTASTSPHDVDRYGEAHFPIFEQAAKNGDLKGIGETGLDYFYEHSPKELQKKYLVKYLHLALETKLPVVIHCREAFNDFFEIIDAEYQSADGILHCFTGTMEEAKQVIKRDWYLSLSGIVTFKKSVALQEVAKWVPLEKLLIETDTPYLAPQGKRGRLNEPANLPEIAQFIAHLKGISVDEVAQATAQNAYEVFRL